MKVLFLIPLFAALLVTGCGESEPVGEATVASAKEESPIDTPPLDIKTIAALAAKHQGKVEERENIIVDKIKGTRTMVGYLYYIKGTDKLYSGVHYEVVSGPEGDPVLYAVGTIKDGKPDSLQTAWHENGQKALEATYKDGEEVSMKYWNSKGEEVETAEEVLEKSLEKPAIKLSAEVKKLLEEAVFLSATEEREGLLYLPGESEPYSGWVKGLGFSGEVSGLERVTDGKPDGPSTRWHENGQKKSEGIYKDGEEVSAKYWNSKGEEVETAEEAEE